MREKGIEKEIREMEIRKIGIGDRNRATLEIKKFRERDGVAEINRSRRDWCVCVYKGRNGPSPSRDNESRRVDKK